MDLNATLFGQIITFAIFIWFVMKYVWPPLINIMEERKQKIADGLAASEKGHRELELAAIKTKEQLADAKAEAAKIVEQANHRAAHIVEEAKSKAREEGDRLLQLAQAEIEQEKHAARESLIREVSGLAVTGAERILSHNIDGNASAKLIDELIGEV